VFSGADEVHLLTPDKFRGSKYFRCRSRAATRDHHTVSRIYFLVGTFCRVRSIVLAAATKLRQIEKRDHGVIHVPPACRRITLEIFLLVLPHLGHAKVPPTSLRAVFLCPVERVRRGSGVVSNYFLAEL